MMETILASISTPRNKQFCLDQNNSQYIYFVPNHMYLAADQAQKRGHKTSKKFFQQAKKYSTTLIEYVTDLWNSDEESKVAIDIDGNEIYSTKYFADGEWFGIDTEGLFICDLEILEN